MEVFTLALVVHFILTRLLKFSLKTKFSTILYDFLFFILLEGVYNTHWFVVDFYNSRNLNPHAKTWLIDLFGKFELRFISALVFGICLMLIGFLSVIFFEDLKFPNFKTKFKYLIIIVLIPLMILNSIYVWKIALDAKEKFCWLFICDYYGRVYSWAFLFTFTAVFYIIRYLFPVKNKTLFAYLPVIYFLGLFFWDRGQGALNWKSLEDQEAFATFFGQVIEMKIKVMLFIGMFLIWLSYIIPIALNIKEKVKKKV